MRKIRFVTVAVCAILVLIVAGMQVIELVDANPYWIYKQVNPLPDTIPPTITMFSPLNNATYSSGRITVSFNVSRPQLATSWTNIFLINYTLDNKQNIVVYSENLNVNTLDREGTQTPEFKTTFTLPILPTGNHTLTVQALGAVVPSHLEIFYINSTSTTFFTVETRQSLQESQTNYLLNQTFLTAIVSVIVIAIVALVSLVYFKKRKH
jgi:hypothetical protein